ncbi:MAG: TIGR00297 family protein [Halarchaeum sp.]
MTLPLRRAVAYALVSTLALAAPLLGRFAAAPFAAVAVLAYVTTDGAAFRLFAYPWDENAGRLRTLVGFALAVTGLGVFVVATDLPFDVFVVPTLAVAYGDFGRRLVLEYYEEAIGGTVGFVAVSLVGAFCGQAVVAAAVTAPMAFLAAVAALLAALCREVLTERDYPYVVFTVALLCWLLVALSPTPGWVPVGVALAVTVVFGGLSYALGAASITGMLTGVFLGVLAVVLGGYGWFVVLVTFFGVGGIASKYRYDEKAELGVAEENDGARGSGNVLGNSLAALFALLAYAASPMLPVHGVVFAYAFAGSVATALADTLSSEIGTLYGPPRLLTTLEEVPPGTDGAVTWQGELAGVAGALVVAALAYALLSVSAFGALVVVAGGIVGMTVDSVAGATIEGRYAGNQTVNFLATLAGGVVAALLALAL